jgi:hypothetical protein
MYFRLLTPPCIVTTDFIPRTAPVSVTEVRQALKSLKASERVGLVCVLLFIIKCCSGVFVPLLTEFIFKHSVVNENCPPCRENILLFSIRGT